MRFSPGSICMFVLPSAHTT